MFTAINQTFASLLIYLANFLGGNLGFAIIAFTIIIRGLLVPLTLPSLKSQNKLRDLKPQLDQLKKQFGHDKKLHSQKQLELYQQHGLNPAAGCLPQILQLIVLIVLYQVLINTLNGTNLDSLSLDFYGLKLNHPDTTYILPIIAGLTQFILGVMLMPATSTKAEHQLAAQTHSKKDDKAADTMTDMAGAMQTQMIFVMPIITVLFASRFPSGLALYWVATTVFSIVQQYFVSGLGGLKPYLAKIGLKRS